MNPVSFRHKFAARLGQSLCLVFFCCLFLAAGVRAEDSSLTNLLAQGDLHEKQGDTRAALKCFLDANQMAPTNAEILCRLAKQYCDMLHLAKSKAEEKDFAQKSLDWAQRAAAADPQNPKAHVCVAVCCAKNFPYCDSQTRVNYSRQIKAEAEKAIALDPKYDLPYHMLGRWNCEVANMNIFLIGLVKIVYGGLPKASNEVAIENFKKAIALAPNRIIHHLQLARVYHISGKEKLMTEELKACQGLAPVDLDDTDAKKISAKILETGHWPTML